MQKEDRMQTNVLEYLEKTVNEVPDKVAFADDKIEVTFQQFYDSCRAIGSYFSNENVYKEPVLIFMEKTPHALTAFFGTIYGGNYYVPIDDEMPKRRIELIIENTKARVFICDHNTVGKVDQLGFQGKVILFDDIIKTAINQAKLNEIREQSVDLDPIYVLFTSGSTGIPKGVVGHHRGVIDYIENLSEVLEFDRNTVFGNQAPLYFDACMKEIYPTMKYGATTYLIPKQLFMFPVKLLEFMNEKKINTVCWVVSALTMISAFGTFEVVKPEHLHTIAFGSEVFPIKQFNIWKKTLPDASFTNLYGPTEATGMSCYYKTDREFEADEVIPIGRPFHNTQIILVSEEGKAVPKGEVGEICIRGTCLTSGYYNNEEKTKEVFVQNPLNLNFTDLIYRTGDLGKYNEENQLLFVSRKDYQIKHMGHRIELGEIEANVTLEDRVKAACCIYIKESGKIALFYVGDITKKELSVFLKEKLPRYMIPNTILQLDRLPLTPNGKMNRIEMEKIYQSEKERK